MRRTFFSVVMLSIAEIIFSQADTTVYSNDFSQQCFAGTASVSGKSWCRDGKFHAEHYDSLKIWEVDKNINFNPGADFRIETSLILLNNSEKGYGLVFGKKDANNANYFLLSSTGFFKIIHEEKGKETVLQDWKKNTAIKTAGASNSLSVRKKGGSLFFYINDAEVAFFPLDKIRILGGRTGFQLSGKQTVEADYLRVAQKKRKILLVENHNTFGKKEKLGLQVNSSADEKHPIISPDGRHLYVNRDGHPENTGDEKKADIWVSELQSDSLWGPLKNIGPPLNTTSHNSISGISADNALMLVSGVYMESGNRKGYSFSSFTKNGWGKPVKVEIKNYCNDHEFASACLSADKKVIILSAECDDTYGGSDLYVTFKTPDNTWTEPQNLGPVVNSYADDYTPFLSADGLSLYFASYGHPGYGSADIFMVKRLDDSWTKWSEPRNMGPKINSRSWDAYFTVSAKGDDAYIVSYESSGNNSDIYRVKLSETGITEATVMIQGKVINDKTREPLGAEMKLVDAVTGKPIQTLDANNETGDYGMIVKKPGRYYLASVKEGFIAIQKTIEIKEIKEYREIKLDLVLTPIEKGATIVLKNIFFTPNKFDLLPESYEELNKLVLIMNENPNLKIEVSGHTSKNNEGEKFNEELSTNRALAVKNYLVQHGVNQGRVVHKGYGFSKPLYLDEGQEHQALNRRVEFTILSK